MKNVDMNADVPVTNKEKLIELLNNAGDVMPPIECVMAKVFGDLNNLNFSDVASCFVAVHESGHWSYLPELEEVLKYRISEEDVNTIVQNYIVFAETAINDRNLNPQVTLWFENNVRKHNGVAIAEKLAAKHCESMEGLTLRHTNYKTWCMLSTFEGKPCAVNFNCENVYHREFYSTFEEAVFSAVEEGFRIEDKGAFERVLLGQVA